MSKKKETQQLQLEITSDEEWDDLLTKPGLWVVDVYRDWSGPCACAQNALKKIKLEMADDFLNFALAACDNIKALEVFRQTCEPQWLFLAAGQMVGVMKGADISKLSRMILKEVDKERDVLAGKATRSVISNLSDILKPTRLDFGNPAEEEEEKELGLRLLRAVAKVQFTAKALSTRQYTLALIKPDAIQNGNLPDIIQTLRDNFIQVLYQQERILTADEVKVMYQALAEEPFFKQLVTFMTSGPSVVLVLSRQPGHGTSIITEWKELLGPPDATKAKMEAPESLRAKFGFEGFSNALHGSDNEEHASSELNFFFPQLGEQIQRQKQVVGDEQTLEYSVVVVRPTTFQKFTKDDIVDMFVKENIQVIAKRKLSFTEDFAEQLYAHVSGPRLESLVQATTGGSCLAVVVSANEIIKQLLNILGPENLKEAQTKYPSSWRAKYTPGDQAESGFYTSRSRVDAKRDVIMLFPHLQTEFEKLEKKHSDTILMTKAKLGASVQYAVILVMPQTIKAYKYKTILKTIAATRLHVYANKLLTLSRNIADDFFLDWIDKPEFNKLVDQAISGPCLVVCVMSENIIQVLKDTLGPVSIADAKQYAPDSLRSLFSSYQDTFSPMYSSEKEIAATNHLKLFFPEIQEQVMNISKGKVPRYCVVIISPIVLENYSKEKIEKAFFQDELPFICETMLTLTESQAEHLYSDYKSDSQYDNTIDAVTSSNAWIIGVYTTYAEKKVKESLATGALSAFKTPEDKISFRVNSSPKTAIEEMDVIFPNEVTFAIIKPDAYPSNEEQIMKIIVDFGLQIASENVMELTPSRVSEFYKAKTNEPFFEDLVNFMCSGKVKLLALRGHGAVKAWRRLMGPTDPEEAKKIAPYSIRAQFGKSKLSNAVHGSAAPEEAAMKMNMSMAGTEIIDSEVPHVDMVYNIHTIHVYAPVRFTLFLIQFNLNSKSSKNYVSNKGILIENSTKLHIKNISADAKYDTHLIIAPVQIFPNKERKNNRDFRDYYKTTMNTAITKGEKTETHKNCPNFFSYPIKRLDEIRIENGRNTEINRPYEIASSLTNELSAIQRYKNVQKCNFKACFSNTNPNNILRVILPSFRNTESSDNYNSRMLQIEEHKHRTKLDNKVSIPKSKHLHDLKKERDALMKMIATNVKEVENIKKNTYDSKPKMLPYPTNYCLDAKLTDNHKLYITLLQSMKKNLTPMPGLNKQLQPEYENPLPGLIKQFQLECENPSPDLNKQLQPMYENSLSALKNQFQPMYENALPDLNKQLHPLYEKLLSNLNKQLQPVYEKHPEEKCVSTQTDDLVVEATLTEFQKTYFKQAELKEMTDNMERSFEKAEKEKAIQAEKEKAIQAEKEKAIQAEKEKRFNECILESKECQATYDVEQKICQTRFDVDDKKCQTTYLSEKNFQMIHDTDEKSCQAIPNTRDKACQTKPDIGEKKYQTEYKNAGKQHQTYGQRDIKDCQTEMLPESLNKVDYNIDAEIAQELESKLMQMMNTFQEASNISGDNIPYLKAMRSEAIDAVYNAIITAKIGIDPSELRKNITEMFIPNENICNTLSECSPSEQTSLTTTALQQSTENKISSNTSVINEMLQSNQCMMNSPIERQTAGKEYLQGNNAEEVSTETISNKKSISSTSLNLTKEEIFSSREKITNLEENDDTTSEYSATVVETICSGAVDPILHQLLAVLKDFYLNED